MTAISQALEDIKKYLEIKGVRNIKVDYFDVNDDSYKSVRLTFNSEDFEYESVITRKVMRK